MDLVTGERDRVGQHYDRVKFSSTWGSSKKSIKKTEKPFSQLRCMNQPSQLPARSRCSPENGKVYGFDARPVAHFSRFGAV